MIKWNYMKRLLLIFLLVGLILSCEDTGDNDHEIIKISYGTSFGECLGYCKTDMILITGLVTYSRSGWVDTVETITCTETLENEDWNIFKNSLNPDEFFKLSETIGCPDCADGGAEWIEIEVGSGKKHKVTFEYMNEPEELKSCATSLRLQYEQFIHCGEK